MASPVHKACSLHTGSHYPCSPLYPGAQPSTEASRASTTQVPLTSQQSTKAEDGKATRGIDCAGSPVRGLLGTRQWLGHSEGPAAGQSCAERPLEDRRAHRGRRRRGNLLHAGQVAAAAAAHQSLEPRWLPDARMRRAAQTLGSQVPESGRGDSELPGSSVYPAGAWRRTSRRVNSQPTSRGHYCPSGDPEPLWGWDSSELA